MKNFKGVSTTALHSFKESNNQNAHLTPIYASSTFVFDNVEDGFNKFNHIDKKNIYTRWGNPSFEAVEETIAALEGYHLKDSHDDPLELKALIFASGQAALSTLFMSNVASNETILSHFSLYGGTQELIQKVLAASGIKNILADLNDEAILRHHLATNSSIKLIHLETPCNPTNQCVDIETITKIAHEYHCKVSVDNTFATPFLQQPFKFGVDFVMHSTTKFLNGHGSAIGGVLIGSDIEFMKTKVWKWQVLLGGTANPFDAFLLMNGLKTLEIRMLKHCENADKLAHFLAQHPKILKVNFCGLQSHPQYHLAKKQHRLPPPVISFELKSGFEGAKKFINDVKICVKAVSLGTLDTLVSHPASMTHYGISAEERIKFQITDALIRMSVGIENYEDLEADIEQAMN
ncbi:MAG: aminotransferase class I/II-fold pyridoxal phosphate-dependent enzyme [Alphaproteobacteria bacterium]|nr:aminotransferase class I/II-fold pyridoxal phosphate-dependent enzyme [Alphaproteobacteria bacterium]